MEAKVRTSNVTVLAFYKSIGFAPDDVVSLGKRLEHDHPNGESSPLPSPDMPRVLLTAENELQPKVEQVLAPLFPRLRELLPDAEIEHIGATAIPGALTKGDVDVMVRVSVADFQKAVETVKTAFGIKQPENWTKNFASFGDDTGYALPLGIQLVAKDSEADFFVFLRDYLIGNAGALEQYNRLKLQHAGEGPGGYWKAKNTFLSGILARRPR